jgi:deoxyribose-phosphate aldolase
MNGARRLLAGKTYDEIARTIDHALLKPEMTEDEVVAGCELARRYGVASVCCRPCDVPTAARLLESSGVKVGTVIGFPHGAQTTATKVFEARDALTNDAVELDMVVNIGWLRAGTTDAVAADIGAIVRVAGDRAIVKVILETAYLTDDQKILGCRLAAASGAAFVKTSTGFGPAGATVEDVRLMRASVPETVQVKAAGGVRTLDSLLTLMDAGAARIGTSSTAAILDEFTSRQILVHSGETG